MNDTKTTQYIRSIKNIQAYILRSVSVFSELQLVLTKQNTWKLEFLCVA